MKYFFSDNCYWDSSEKIMYRDSDIIKLSYPQEKLLSYLLKKNGIMISHKELYFAMTGLKDVTSNYKEELSSQFSGNGGLEKKIPEIVQWLSKSRAQVGGGYRTDLPEERIIKEGENNPPPNTGNLWFSHIYFSSWMQQALNADVDKKRIHMRQYLEGRYRGWPLYFYSGDNCQPVKRIIVPVLEEMIISEGGIYVLTGAGGEGKTTVLRQLCVEFFKARKSILYHRETNQYSIENSFTDSILLIDNPNNDHRFREFLQSALDLGLTVVFALRSNEWNLMKDSLSIDIARVIREITIPKVSPEEAILFSKCIKSNINNIIRDEDDLTSLFSKDSYGFLYASMLMAIYNKDSLEQITYGIIQGINSFQESRRCLPILACVSFLEACDVQITTRIMKAISSSFNVEKWMIDRYLSKEIVINGSFYQTRHETISRLFYKYLFTEGDWKPFITEEEKNEIYEKILECFLRTIDKLETELYYGSHLANNTIKVTKNLLNLPDLNETHCIHFVQRLVETCKQKGAFIIDNICKDIKSPYIRTIIAEKCFSAEMNNWPVYQLWIDDLTKMNQIDEVRKIYKTLSQFDSINPVMCHKWTRLEEEQNNIGNYEAEGSAAWIFKELCETKLKNDSGCWIHWARLAKKYPDHFPTDSCTSILKRSCTEYDGDGSVWRAWANEEIEKDNIGNYNIIDSAAWILREACINHDPTGDPITWLRWIQLVKNNSDMLIAYEPLQIIRIACIDRKIESQNLYNLWAKEEIARNNIGDYSIMESAAWIYKTASEKQLKIWIPWTDFIEKNGHLITKESNESLLTFLRHQCLHNNVPLNAWTTWAMQSELLGKTGDYDTAETAAWIYKKSDEYVNEENVLDPAHYLYWAKFAYKHPLFKGEEIIDVKYVLDKASQRNPEAFTNPNWKELEEFKSQIEIQ